MNAAMLQSLWLVSIALACALLGGRLLMRWFGARAAFLRWAMVPLFLVLPWLPSLPAPAHMHLPAMSLQPLAISVTAAPAPVALSAVVMLWLAGAVLALAVVLARYTMLRRACRPAPAGDLQALAAMRSALAATRLPQLRIHAHGPALLWAPLRPILLLPAGFFEVHDSAERRRWMLLHELAHMARRDPWWNLLAEILRVLLWFHPLAWLAMRRFRLDQELACDAAVLERHPRHAHGYAQALLASGGSGVVWAANHWLDEPQLKERLTMLNRNFPTTWCRRAGTLSILVSLAAAAVLVQAAPTPQVVSASTAAVPSAHAIPSDLAIGKDGTVSWNGRQLTTAQLHAELAATAASDPRPALRVHVDTGTPYQSVVAVLQSVKQAGLTDVGFASTAPANTAAQATVRLPPPKYPVSAIRARAEGTVVLRVQIGTDGTPLQIQPRPGADPALTAAAASAAWNWRFNPATDKQGKPRVAWADVPVTFSLNDL